MLTGPSSAPSSSSPLSGSGARGGGGTRSKENQAETRAIVASGISSTRQTSTSKSGGRRNTAESSSGFVVVEEELNVSGEMSSGSRSGSRGGSRSGSRSGSGKRRKGGRTGRSRRMRVKQRKNRKKSNSSDSSDPVTGAAMSKKGRVHTSTVTKVPLRSRDPVTVVTSSGSSRMRERMSYSMETAVPLDVQVPPATSSMLFEALARDHPGANTFARSPIADFLNQPHPPPSGTTNSNLLMKRIDDNVAWRSGFKNKGDNGGGGRESGSVLAGGGGGGPGPGPGVGPGAASSRGDSGNTAMFVQRPAIAMNNYSRDYFLSTASAMGGTTASNGVTAVTSSSAAAVAAAVAVAAATAATTTTTTTSGFYRSSIPHSPATNQQLRRGSTHSPRTTTMSAAMNSVDERMLSGMSHPMTMAARPYSMSSATTTAVVPLAGRESTSRFMLDHQSPYSGSSMGESGTAAAQAAAAASRRRRASDLGSVVSGVPRHGGGRGGGGRAAVGGKAPRGTARFLPTLSAEHPGSLHPSAAQLERESRWGLAFSPIHRTANGE